MSVLSDFLSVTYLPENEDFFGDFLSRDKWEWNVDKLHKRSAVMFVVTIQPEFINKIWKCWIEINYYSQFYLLLFKYSNIIGKPLCEFSKLKIIAVIFLVCLPKCLQSSRCQKIEKCSENNMKLKILSLLFAWIIKLNVSSKTPKAQDAKSFPTRLPCGNWSPDEWEMMSISQWPLAWASLVIIMRAARVSKLGRNWQLLDMMNIRWSSLSRRYHN